MAVYTEKLPPAACTPQMREQVARLAEQDNRSASAIVRLAVEKFLSENLRKSTIGVDNVDFQDAAL